jgi:DNA polymerase-3 subunit epsilon
MKHEMKNVLILDLETTGLDPHEDQVIEVGHVLWSVEHRTLVECFSSLVSAGSNGAEPFNAIPVAASTGCDRDLAWEVVANGARAADAVLAHQADFDRGFVEAEPGKQSGSVLQLFETLEPLRSLPWICTIEDFLWPVQRPFHSLVHVALAHGVAVTSAHRAINDCLLLARLLERLGDDVDVALDVALERALRPKARFIARTTYHEKDLVKASGFHWNGLVWSRRMAVEDAEALPFEVITEQQAIEEARA